MTLKQRLAFKKMVENGGNISKAMRDAGYSANTAKTPQKLTNSKSWKQFFEKDSLSDAALINEHAKLLCARKINGEIDTLAVSSALDMAYRLKGKYAPEKVAVAQIMAPSIEVQEQIDNVLKAYIYGK